MIKEAIFWFRRHLWLFLIIAAVMFLVFVLWLVNEINFPTVSFLGGIFSGMFFGVQIYFWLFLIAAIAIITSHLLWWGLFWLPLHPFYGLHTARKNKTNAAVIFDLQLIYELISEKDAKLVYPETVEQAREYQKTWDEAPCAIISGVPTDLVLDSDNWTRSKSPQRRQIEQCIDFWNENHPEDEIHSLSKFQKKLLLGHIICPADVKKTTTVSWLRIDSAFPLARAEAAWAGYKRLLATLLTKEEQAGDTGKYFFYILGFSAVICLLMFLMKFVGVLGK